ncbi:N-acetylmuramoyl-L-alanine amidase family protein [Sphingobium sp.]|uniref:N-acetylmuramoyl-L-alanine amidase family protein n=1 Tax=Sphingobium sp. TaxID=1912891 RepID=UPI0039C98C8C
MLAFLAATLLAPLPNSVLPSSGAAPLDARADMTMRPSRRAPGITVRIPDPAPAIVLPPISGPKDPKRPLVVIDAGHGGHDPGAINAEHGWREKDITLAIARAIRTELLKGGRFRVALTRDEDEYLILQERYGVARRLGADLFISVHADAAIANPQARGASIYTLSEVASDREAARLATRENRADILNGVDLSAQSSSVSNILIDLTQRDTMNRSAQFAKILEREAAPYMAFLSPAHRFASLVVLKSPDTPSVLLETGYISNDEDGTTIRSAAGQQRIARGVTQAITVYFARMAGR